jgi:hypothetical protein
VFDDNLTGMTGMDAPALDGGSAPVVRYQDLLRGSSPASAGAPSLATQRPYAPEVIEAAEEISEIGYGPSPLEVPSYVAPYYGGPQAGYGAPSAEEVMSTYPVLAKGDSGAKVKELQQLLVAAGAMTQQVMNSGPGTFGTQTEASVKAFQTVKHLPVSGAVSIDTWLALYGLTKPSQRTEAEASDAPTRGVKGTTGTDARGGAAKGAGSFLEAFNVGMGYKEDPKKKFEVSGKSNDSVGDGTDWGKVALWGGVAVAGIVATVLVVRAVRSKE